MLRKSIIGGAIAAAMAASASLAPAQAGGVANSVIFGADALQSAPLVEKVGWRSRRRGLAIGAGIVTLGILGAIAADRAYGRPHYYRSRRWQCRRWRRACHRGNNRACWRFDTRC